MTLREWTTGTAVVAVAIAAGVVSVDAVNRRYPQVTVPAAPSTEVPTPAAPDAGATAPAPCVRADGSWKNWPWPNVPLLSPKCADGEQ